MTRPSEELKHTRVWVEEPMLQEIHNRYRMWTPENWSPSQASWDMGVLMGIIARLDKLRKGGAV